MKKLLKGIGALLLVLLLVLGGGYAWASSTTASMLNRTFDVHTAEFPVPFELTAAEIEDLRRERLASLAGTEEPTEDEDGQPIDPLAGVDLEAVALERAIERGRHLVTSRYACIECHGEDFSGGVMIDDPLIGRLLGPNITSGQGGKTAGYTPSDWDRIVRHGVRPDGRAGAMPSEDFQLMSDQELSDVVAYIQTVEPVANETPPVSLGPLGTFLMATGKMRLSADVVHDHASPHPVHPPPTGPTATFGRHLAGVCTGCHRGNLEGGPISFGPPDWAPAANLTPHPEGLAGWSYEQFVTAMREGVRPDGTELRPPMNLMKPYAIRMTDVELQALWSHFQSLPPTPLGR